MPPAIGERQQGQPYHRQGQDPREAEEGVAESVKKRAEKSIIFKAVVSVPLSEDGGVGKAMQGEGWDHNEEEDQGDQASAPYEAVPLSRYRAEPLGQP